VPRATEALATLEFDRFGSLDDMRMVGRGPRGRMRLRKRRMGKDFDRWNRKKKALQEIDFTD
jgi:hypothetical protein